MMHTPDGAWTCMDVHRMLCSMWCLVGVAVVLPLPRLHTDLQPIECTSLCVFELRKELDLVSAMFDNLDI